MFSHRLLSAGEEERLLRAAKAGDQDARDQVILCNVRLASHVAKRYRDQGLEWYDLMSEALIGLIRAVERFDPEHRVRFSTCAYWWIRQQVVRAVNDQSRTIRVSGHARQSVQRQNRGESLTACQRERAKDALRACGIRSLEDPSAENGTMLRDTLPARVSAPVLVPPAPEDWQRVAQAIRKLDKRSRQILTLRYWYGWTLRQVSERVGVSRERIRQIQREAEARLREWLGEV